MWAYFTKTARELRRNLGSGFGASYRPDLHYMRGPGPKWQAKYGALVTTSAPHASASGTSLQHVAERRA